LPFTIFYEPSDRSPDSQPLSITIDKVVDIKDPVGHSIAPKELEYRAAREAH